MEFADSSTSYEKLSTPVGFQPVTAEDRCFWLSLIASSPSIQQYRRCGCHSSFCSSSNAPTSLTIATSLRKIPTTSVRRLISVLRRSSGSVEAIYRYFRQFRGKVTTTMRHCSRAASGVSSANAVLISREPSDADSYSRMRCVAHKMHAAALPRRCKDLAIAALRPTCASEMMSLTSRRPRRVRSRKNFVQNGSAPQGLPRDRRFPLRHQCFHGDGDYHRNGYDTASLTHFHVCRVDPQIRPIAFERSSEKRVHSSVNLAAKP